MVSMKIYPVYIKEKQSIVPVYIPSSYSVFVHFLEGQVHKESKLEVMTIMSNSHLSKHSKNE